MCLTRSTSTAYCITERQLRSLCTTTFATLRWTNISPGSMPQISFAGTRLSEQPIHKYSGACWRASVAKKSGSRRRTDSAHSWFFLKSVASGCIAHELSAIHASVKGNGGQGEIDQAERCNRVESDSALRTVC